MLLLRYKSQESQTEKLTRGYKKFKKKSWQKNPGKKQNPRLQAAQRVQDVAFSEKQSVGLRSPRPFLCLDIELCVKSWGV